MVLFNYALKELTAKIVYYGPGLCGKTTNLQFIYEELPIKNKGKMLTLATETDRTLYFDFLPVEAGIVRGIKTRIQLYTVPGQVFYNATRQMVLKGADGIVFVADSQRNMMEANLESMANLRQNLLAHDLRIEEMPLVLQYNKRDLPDILRVDQMNEKLNASLNAPFYEAVAIEGIGVEDTLRAISQLVLKSVMAKYGGARKPIAPAPPAISKDATTQPAAGEGQKWEEKTILFAEEPPAVAKPPGKELVSEATTWPSMLQQISEHEAKREKQVSAEGYEELDLEEILGKALENEPEAEPFPVAGRRDPMEEIDLQPDSAPRAEPLEEALSFDEPEAEPMGPFERASKEDIGVIEARLEALTSRALGSDEETPVVELPWDAEESQPAASPPMVTSPSFDVQVEKPPAAQGPHRVLVPIHLSIDRNTEEMELQITLHIRVSRAASSA